jgi:hypothetical protein
MGQNKVFEIDSYIDPKTKVVSRRFVDNSSYFRQFNFFTYKNPCIGASHILKDGKWFTWNINGWLEIEEPIIVKTIKELNKQEL